MSVAEVDLLEHVRGLAAAVARGGTVYEMASRARMAGDAARGLAAVAALTDPYRAGEGSALIDQLRVVVGRGDDDARDARDRLARHELAVQARALADQTTADTPGLLPAFTPPGPVDDAPPEPGLLSLCTLVPALRKTATVPQRDTLPVGTVDVTEKTEVGSATVTVDGVDAVVHSGSWVQNLSRQLTEWTDLGAAELDALARNAAAAALEGALVTDLTAAATAQAAGDSTADSLDAATSAAATAAGTATGMIVLAAPGDVAKIARGYATITGAPSVVSSPAMTDGRALVFPRSVLAGYKTAMEILSAVEPSIFGVAAGYLQYAFVAVRRPGAVIDLTLPAVTP